MDGRKLSHEAREEIRIRAVQRVDAGESPEVAVATLGFHRSRIYDWLARYREGGLDALRFKTIPGCKPSLSGPQLKKLFDWIAFKNPQQLQFEFALWTRDMIRQIIKREFGISLSNVSIGRLLRKLGLSPQKPLRRAYQQDAEAVSRWKETEYPEIRKAAKKEGAQIFFADEVSVRSDYHTGTTWAPVGQTPVVEKTGARFSINMISAISLGGELRFMTIEGKMVVADTFIEFLKLLSKDTNKPVYLIVDRHPVHRSGRVRDFVESTECKLKLFFLPSYSPQLNPDEHVWNNIKNHGVGKALRRAGSVEKAVLKRLRSLQKLPATFRGFFGHPEILYTVDPDVG